MDNKGCAYFKQGKYAEALDAVNKAIEINPQYANAIYNKGIYCLLQNNVDDGLKLLKESFEIDSSYREMAKTDNDFDSIRDDPRFQTLIFLE